MNNSEVLQWFSERAERHKINILNGRVVRSNISPVVGGNALLYRGTLDKKTRVAIKTARFTPKNDRKTLQRILREVHVWSKLRHENIIVLLGVVTDFDFTLSMVIEWMEMGNAHHYVQDRTNDPRPLILGIARGLAYLHSHKPGPVFHGDLKGDNVLISNDGHALITDFGLSALLESSLSIAISEPHGGTYKYMAPEIWEDPAKISAAGDVWAFGMTALELFTRRTPFQGTENAMAVMIRISRGHPNRPNSDSTCHRMTQEWWDLCVSCWNYQVSTRPKITHLVSEIEILVCFTIELSLLLMCVADEFPRQQYYKTYQTGSFYCGI
ncbi:kinase-like domain-containing protein [Scleroderma yunnanense]